jgi:hypothetical protein
MLGSMRQSLATGDTSANGARPHVFGAGIGCGRTRHGNGHQATFRVRLKIGAKEVDNARA